MKNFLTFLIKIIAFAILLFNSYIITPVMNIPLLLILTPFGIMGLNNIRLSSMLIILSLALIIILATLNSHINGFNDIALLKFALYATVLFLCIKGFSRYYQFSKRQFVNYLFLFLSLNSALVVITTLLPSSRVIYKVIAINPKVFEYPIPRYPGLVYDGFSYLSVFTVLGLTLCLIYRNKLYDGLSRPVDSLQSIISLLGTLISGRLGILFAFFLSILWPKKVIFYKILLLCLVVLGVRVFAYNIYENIAGYVTWNLLQVINIIVNGVVADSSSADLFKNHMELKNNDFFTMLFGNGDFGFGESNYISDSGYIKIFNGMGILGGVVFMLLLLTLLYDRSTWMKLFFAVLCIAMVKDFYLFFPYYLWSLAFFWLCVSGSES